MSKELSHLQSLLSSQRSLEKILGKIKALENDSFSPIKHEEQSDNESETDIWENMIRNLAEEREYIEEYFNERQYHRFNKYYKNFINNKDKKDTQKLIKIENTKFRHIADNLIDILEKTTTNSLKDVKKYFKISQRESKLLEREIAIKEAINQLSDSDTESPTRKYSNLEAKVTSSLTKKNSFNTSDDSPLKNENTNSISSTDQDSEEQIDSDFNAYKNSIKEKDSKRREILRTKAAIHDLKMKKEKESYQSIDEIKFKETIKKRLDRLKNNQRKYLETHIKHAQPQENKQNNSKNSSEKSSPNKTSVRGISEISISTTSSDGSRSLSHIDSFNEFRNELE